MVAVVLIGTSSICDSDAPLPRVIAGDEDVRAGAEAGPGERRVEAGAAAGAGGARSCEPGMPLVCLDVHGGGASVRGGLGG